MSSAEEEEEKGEKRERRGGEEGEESRGELKQTNVLDIKAIYYYGKV